MADTPASFATYRLLQQVTVFVMAVFVGFQVVWNVTPALHTPLMSVTNAISGIIVVGGLLSGRGEWAAPVVLAVVATLFATINISGGFIVTRRMLMFRKWDAMDSLFTNAVALSTVAYVVAGVMFVSGAVYPATLSVSRLDAMAAGAVQGYGTRGGGYSVRWSMGDRTYSARFAPLTFKPPARSVAVVANRHRRILVAIDGKLFSAKRPLRIERSDRFPYARLF